MRNNIPTSKPEDKAAFGKSGSDHDQFHTMMED